MSQLQDPAHWGLIMFHTLGCWGWVVIRIVSTSVETVYPLDQTPDQNAWSHIIRELSIYRRTKISCVRARIPHQKSCYL